MASPATDTTIRPTGGPPTTRRPLGAVVLVGALAYGVWSQGAYHQWQHQVFAVLVGVAAAVTGAMAIGRRALFTGAVIVSPLLVSSMLSIVLSSDRSDAGSTVLEILLVGVGLAVGLSITRTQFDHAVKSIVVVALIVAVTAVLGVASHEPPWGRVTEGVWRGSSSLTYANAAATVCGPMALLAFGRAALFNSRAYAVATVAFTIGLASTQSRGGVLATAVIAVVLVAYLGVRRSAETALPIALGVGIGTPLLLVLAPDSATERPVLVLIGVALGLAATAATWDLRARVPKPQAVLVALAVVGLLTGALDPLTERLTLRSGTTSQGESAEVLFGDRAKEWSTAWSEFTEKPVAGHGPGVVNLEWTEPDGRSFRAEFVHNEYLEFAVTNGVIGIAALAASAWLAVRQVTLSRDTWPIVVAVAAFLLHSTVDFLWHLPALPVLFAMLLGMTSRTLRGRG